MCKMIYTNKMIQRQCPLALYCAERITAADEMVENSYILADRMPESTETNIRGDSDLYRQLEYLEEGMQAKLEDVRCTSPRVRRRFLLVGGIVSIECCSKDRIARISRLGLQATDKNIK